ncbi:MAG: DUF1616 domain-containing protein [Nitrososphaerota archaeon]
MLEDIAGEGNWWERLNRIVELYRSWVEGELSLEDPNPPRTLPEYILRPDYSLWMYTVLSITIITIVLIHLTNYIEALLPLRYVLGSITVLFLPGYTLLQALYRPGELTPLEELALSIGLSLAVVPLIGLVLNYTPWGIRLTPIITSLCIYTMVLILIATIRRYRSLRT